MRIGNAVSRASDTCSHIAISSIWMILSYMLKANEILIYLTYSEDIGMTFGLKKYSKGEEK